MINSKLLSSDSEDFEEDFYIDKKRKSKKIKLSLPFPLNRSLI